MTYQYFSLITGHPETVTSAPVFEPDSLAGVNRSGMCIMQWNGVFVPLDFKYNLSWMALDSIQLVELLLDGHTQQFDVTFPSNSFRVDWRITKQGEVITVEPTWHSVLGGLESMLAERSPLTYGLEDFTVQWQRLLGVFVRAILESSVSPELVADYERLRQAAIMPTF